MSVIAFAEQRGGAFKKSAFEAVAEAKRLADKLGTQAVAVVIGNNVSGIAAELGKYGASKVYVAENAALENYSTEGYTQALNEAVKKENAAVVLLGATAMGKDLAPRTAARLGAGIASDVTGLDVEGGKITITRPIMSGKAFQKLRITTATQVITIRPNVFKATESGATAAVENLSMAIAPIRATVKNTVVESGKKVELTEADVVVSGGRGLKAPENWNLVVELAEAFGGAHGASRAVVDAGWRSHEEQVGQTGKTVSPQLYIACGISGAIQHLAGMSSSKYIVAINSDAEAPIFKIADYGIVGDVMEILPAMTAQVRKIKGK
ncbi:MAG TPA: electron transfer flavoprotein subunit alpha/FixB family protein [bacterium]|nr:electron transfer flavoprotein subunit alpha/FixB family protein [bacterium]HNB57054.1 electron transfer flavoprotein subunit alpha/FixB family protein [bacterium]